MTKTPCQRGTGTRVVPVEQEVQEYAVVEIAGHQYRVRPGDEVLVQRLAASPGQELAVDRVLLVERDGQVLVGRPWVEGARAVLHVLEHLRGRKIRVFKYKPKVNYRRRRGHRQPFTRVRVERIELGEGAGPAQAPAAQAQAAARG
ncbi:MAG TPA: 50S ribosomal protein L21 [Limnochordales bacterium]